MSPWQIGFLVVAVIVALVSGISYWSGPDCRDPKGMYGAAGQTTFLSCLAVGGIVGKSYGLGWGLGATIGIMIVQTVLGSMMRRDR